MKLGFLSSLWAISIVSLCLALLLVCALPGVVAADVNSKDVDKSLRGIVTSSTKKSSGNDPKSDLPLECPQEDVKCENDRLGLEAIRSLHFLIDDDHNGDVDQHESDEFLRDELQYTDGFERQALFHNNDKFISVDDLWRAWKLSIVHNWTVEEVGEWLTQDVELPQYAPAFVDKNIDGSVLPRLVNSSSTLLTALGIRNMHKQKLAVKAMDAVLVGAPKRMHSFTKDLLLVSSLILAVGGCWFACLHHRYSQTQVKKMMKDLEALQKAEDALKKLSEITDAEKSQSTLSQEKQEELKILRQNSLRLQVPKLSTSSSGGGGDKSPKTLSREGSAMRRQEGEKKLKQAEEELNALREALTEAEQRLELQQQLENQWSVRGELQAWLQLTYELELQQLNIKKQEAERQRLAARDGCDKIKKRNKAFFGSLRIAHSNSLDDIEQTIMDARVALEEVRQNLQESQQRWQIMEILCDFPIIVNPGLAALRQVLGRDATGNVTRGATSLLQASSIEEVEEDIPSAARAARGYPCNTAAQMGKSSAMLKQQSMAGSTNSLPHVANTSASTLPRRDSRDTDMMLKSPHGAESPAANSTSFHLGPQDVFHPGHERTHSNASISMVSSLMTNGHHHHHHHGAHHQQQQQHHHLRTPYSQSLSHPPFLSPNIPPSHPGLAAGSSTGNLSSSGVINTMLSHGHRSTGMMYPVSGASGGSGHLKIVSPGSTSGRNGVGMSSRANGDAGSHISRQESGSTLVGSHTPPDAQSSPVEENTERTSLDSMSHMVGSGQAGRGRLDRTMELDISSVDTDSVYSGGGGATAGIETPEMSPQTASPSDVNPPNLQRRLKKASKKKKFLPNFLQKGKGKQKTS